MSVANPDPTDGILLRGPLGAGKSELLCCGEDRRGDGGGQERVE